MFQRGGSEDDDMWRAAWVSCVVLAVLAIAAPWPLIRSRWGLVAVGSLAALTAWTALSIEWARIEIYAADDAGRLLLYTTFLAAALIVARSPKVRRALPWGLLIGISAASVYGLGTRLLPEIFEAELIAPAGSRLAHPITYWNSLGMLTGCGTLLAITCAAGDRAAPRLARAAACSLGVLCTFALYLTLSRGSFVAIVAGLVVIALARPRLSTALAGAATLVPAGLLAVALVAFPAVRETPREGIADQVSQGRIVAVLAVLAAIGAGVAFALLLRPRVERDERRLRRAGPLAATAVAVLLVATVVVSYASEQSEQLSTSTSRLSEARTFRGPYWDIALDSFADHPLNGVGSGSFQVEWLREAPVPRGALDAHSLYFETLGELGIVGGLFLLGFVVALVAGTLASARTLPGDAVLPGAAAVVAAYLVHAGVDWDWKLPAVTLPFLLMAAAALTRPEPDLD
jgi:hypothetical protein